MGPWEKYQSAPAGQPWAKYQKDPYAASGGVAPPMAAGVPVTAGNNPGTRDSKRPGIFGSADDSGIPGASTGVDTLESAWRGVAAIVGVPSDVMFTVLDKVAGDGNRDPWQNWNRMTQELTDMGMVHPDAELGAVGEALGKDALGAMFLNLGALATAAKPLVQGAGRMTRVAHDVGSGIMQKPVAAAAGEVGASLGGTAGREFTASDSLQAYPYVRAPIELGASILGGATASGALATARGMARETVPNVPFVTPAKPAGIFTRGTLVGQPQPPHKMQAPWADPSLVAEAARQESSRVVQATDDRIVKLVSDISQKTRGGMIDPPENFFHLSPEQQQITALKQARRQAQAAAGEIQHTERLAHAQQEVNWDAADRARPVDMFGPTGVDRLPIQEWAQAQLDEALQFSTQTLHPVGLLNRLVRLGPEARLSDLVGAGSIRSEALRHLRGQNGGSLAANLTDLQGRILDTVRAAYPDDELIANAHEFSRWYNEKFWNPEAPLHTFMRPLSDNWAEEAMHGLVQQSNAGPELLEVSTRMHYDRVKRSVEQSIAETFKSITLNETPEKAAAYLGATNMKQFLTDFPGEMAELATGSMRLNTELANRDAVTRGLFTQASGEVLSQTVGRILDAGAGVDVKPNFPGVGKAGSAQVAQAVMDGLANSNPTTRKYAEEAIHGELANQLMSQANQSAVKLEQLIGQKNISQVIDIVMGAKASRFRNLVHATAVVEAQNTRNPVIKASRFLITGGAAIAGAATGRMLGTGTIQVPGQFSRVFRDIAGTYFGQINATKTMGWALNNPHFEKMLFAEVPRNRSQAKALFKRTNKILSAAMMGMRGIQYNLAVSQLPQELQERE